MTQYRFQLWQDGMLVAAVDCADRKSAMKEIMHYAAIYEQDGPVKIREVKPRTTSVSRPSQSSEAK